MWIIVRTVFIVPAWVRQTLWIAELALSSCLWVCLWSRTIHTHTRHNGAKGCCGCGESVVRVCRRGAHDFGCTRSSVRVKKLYTHARTRVSCRRLRFWLNFVPTDAQKSYVKNSLTSRATLGFKKTLAQACDYWLCLQELVNLFRVLQKGLEIPSVSLFSFQNPTIYFIFGAKSFKTWLFDTLWLIWIQYRYLADKRTPRDTF